MLVYVEIDFGWVEVERSKIQGTRQMCSGDFAVLHKTLSSYRSHMSTVNFA